MTNQGFTLIELLVTVAIIGVVSLTAFGEFSSYKRRAYDAVVITDIKNSTVAIEAFLADHVEESGGLDPDSVGTSIVPCTGPSLCQSLYGSYGLRVSKQTDMFRVGYNTSGIVDDYRIFAASCQGTKDSSGDPSMYTFGTGAGQFTGQGGVGKTTKKAYHIFFAELCDTNKKKK